MRTENISFGQMWVALACAFGWLGGAELAPAYLAAIGVGVVVHDRLERPVTQALRRRFDRGRLPQTARH